MLLTGIRSTNEAQPSNRPERPTASLSGTRRAARAGAGSSPTLGVPHMTTSQFSNVRLTFSSLAPLFFIVGCGAGVLLTPLSIAEFASHGIGWMLGAAFLTPLIHGVYAVILLTLGFPGYVLVARKRRGYAVELTTVPNAGAADARGDR